MGVIQQSVPDYPLAHTLFDAEWLKGMSGRRALSPAKGWVPRVHGTPYDVHQDWGLGCFLRHDRFLLFADTGLGKTKIALDAIDYHFTHRGAKHALVLTGNAAATYEWTDQGERYIQTAVRDVQGSVAQRRKTLLHFPQTPIVATDYSTLQTAFAVKVKKPGRTQKMHWVPDFEVLYQFGRQFDIVVLDEIHRLSNPTSLRSQMVAALVTDIPIRYGLTGTPFDRHPENAWHQFHVIDGGETFQTQHNFLQYFFYTRPAYFNKYHVEYAMRPEIKADFKRRVRHRALRITAKECTALPDVRRQFIRVAVPPGAMTYMAAAKKRIRDAHEQKEQSNEFNFLRQLCSGLLRIKDDDSGINETVRLPGGSTKIDWLVSFLESLPEKEQLVVFYEFRASGDWLNEELLANKHTVSWLHGGMRESELDVLATWRQKKTRVLLSQTEKAAESLNLQQAAYLVQYESPLTYRQEKQSLARVGGRIGGRSSIIYTLTVKGSSEQRILDLIREGKEISQELLEGEDEQDGLLFGARRPPGAVARGVDLPNARRRDERVPSRHLVRVRPVAGVPRRVPLVRHKI